MQQQRFRLLQVIIALLSVLWPCPVAANSHMQSALPTFAPSKETQSYFLNDSQPWIPSGTTQMTVLSGNAPLNVEIRMTDNGTFYELESYTLLFKCSTLNEDFQQIILDSVNGTGKHYGPSNTHCEYQQGFFVNRISGSTYQIQVTRESNVPFGRSLKHFMEFRFKVTYRQGVLNSSSLYGFTLASIFNINKQKRASGGTDFVQYFLTDEAVRFLMGNFTAYYVNGSVQSQSPFIKVDFINKKLTDLLKTAPQFVRTFLSVSVILNVSSTTGQKVYCFSTGDYYATQIANATNSPNRQFEHSLNLNTGTLLIERVFTKNILQWQLSKAEISLRASLNGKMWSQSGHHAQTVSRYTLRISGVNDPPGSTTSSTTSDRSSKYQCQTNPSFNSTTLTFYSGMEGIVLASPIVCADAMKSNDITKQRPFWSTQAVSLGNTREDCQKKKYTSDHKHIHGYVAIMITGPINESHAGTYTFSSFQTDKNLTFNYNVRVLDLPTFWGNSVRIRSGDCEEPKALQGVVYANLYKQVELSCKAPQNAFVFAPVDSHLLIMDTSGNDNIWRQMIIKDFAIGKLHVAPKAINQIRSESSLTIALPFVTREWSKWVLTYSCLVQVTGKEVEETLGVTNYQIETSASIYYFDSSVQPYASAGTKLATNKIMLVLVAAVHWLLHQR